MANAISPCRILFLDSWHADRVRGSGSAVAIAGLAAGLRELGHSVTVLRPRYRLPQLDMTRLLHNVELGRRVRHHVPDLVVGFDMDGCLLPPLRVPYVVALKGIMADELLYERGWSRLRFACFSRLERRNALRADRVIVTSTHSRNVAIRAYGLDPERVRVVPEGIDAASWSGRPARRAPDPDDHLPVVLTVARQYRRKNTETLLQAMTRVRKAVPGARLRVVGEGPELPRLRKLAAVLQLDESAVQFVGSLGGTDALKDEFNLADVFCLPSRQEGFGIVFLEAMAMGLPIVAARAGAIPEVAPHDEVALLEHPDDPEGLAAAIVRLLQDTALRDRLVASGSARWKNYAWPSVATRFLEAALSD